MGKVLKLNVMSFQNLKQLSNMNDRTTNCSCLISHPHTARLPYCCRILWQRSHGHPLPRASQAGDHSLPLPLPLSFCPLTPALCNWILLVELNTLKLGLNKLKSGNTSTADAMWPQHMQRHMGENGNFFIGFATISPQRSVMYRLLAGRQLQSNELPLHHPHIRNVSVQVLSYWLIVFWVKTMSLYPFVDKWRDRKVEIEIGDMR